MNTYRFSLIFLSLTGTSLFGTGTMTSEEGPMRQKVNFIGELKTREQPKKLKVDNISFDKMTRRIEVLVVPTSAMYVTHNAEPNTNLLKVPKDQMSGRFINLEEMSELRVPHPEIVWLYKRQTNSYVREIKYLEIEVISQSVQGAKKTKNNYLIERGRKIYYNDLSIPGFEEIHTPITAIESLVITCHAPGYMDANDQPGCSEKAKAQQAREQQKSAPISQERARLMQAQELEGQMVADEAGDMN